MTRALALTTVLLAVAIAGCGGDDAGHAATSTFSIPAVTSPIAPTSTTPFTTTTPTSSSTTTTTKSGKTGGFDANQPDSEGNDVPPTSGSPQDLFEKACKQNPDFCR